MHNTTYIHPPVAVPPSGIPPSSSNGRIATTPILLIIILSTLLLTISAALLIRYIRSWMTKAVALDNNIELGCFAPQAGLIANPASPGRLSVPAGAHGSRFVEMFHISKGPGDPSEPAHPTGSNATSINIGVQARFTLTVWDDSEFDTIMF